MKRYSDVRQARNLLGRDELARAIRAALYQQWPAHDLADDYQFLCEVVAGSVDCGNERFRRIALWLLEGVPIPSDNEELFKTWLFLQELVLAYGTAWWSNREAMVPLAALKRLGKIGNWPSSIDEMFQQATDPNRKVEFLRAEAANAWSCDARTVRFLENDEPLPTPQSGVIARPEIGFEIGFGLIYALRFETRRDFVPKAYLRKFVAWATSPGMNIDRDKPGKLLEAVGLTLGLGAGLGELSNGDLAEFVSAIPRCGYRLGKDGYVPPNVHQWSDTESEPWREGVVSRSSRLRCATIQESYERFLAAQNPIERRGYWDAAQLQFHLQRAIDGHYYHPFCFIKPEQGEIQAPPLPTVAECIAFLSRTDR